MTAFTDGHEMGDLASGIASYPRAARFSRRLDPWPSLQHLKQADRRTVSLLHRVGEATLAPLAEPDSRAMIQLTITADRLLQHIRTYQYRIDNFAGPNSAAQSRKADLELGDFTPGDLVPAPGPQWPDAKNHEVDVILSLLTQAMDLHAIGHPDLRDEAAADAEKLLQHMYAEENDAILIELDNHLHKRREIIFISNHSMSIKTIPKELRHSYDAPFYGLNCLQNLWHIWQKITKEISFLIRKRMVVGGRLGMG